MPRSLRWSIVLVVLLAILAVFAVDLAQSRAPLRGAVYPAAADPFRAPGWSPPAPRPDAPRHRLVLLGDAGDVEADDPTLALAGEWAGRYPDRTVVVYLGDNLYPAGLQEPYRERGEAVLTRLLEVAPVRKVFLPGNHDWGHRGREWLTPGVLLQEQRFVETHGDGSAVFAPRNGCPGPTVIDLESPGQPPGPGLALVALDLHWWLLPEELRPSCEGVSDTEAVVERLRSVLESRADRHVVVAAHHPLRSGGPHGGLSRGFWTDLGIAIAYRFYAAQDLWEPGYREMITVLSGVLAERPPLAFAGGHDHSLQVLEGGDIARLLIVSGAASRISAVTAVEGTLFAHAHPGFVVLDLFAAGSGQPEEVRVRVVETGRGEVFTEARPL